MALKTGLWTIGAEHGVGRYRTRMYRRRTLGFGKYGMIDDTKMILAHVSSIPSLFAEDGF